MANHPDININSRDVQMELRDLASRDWQLWSMGFLVLIVLAAGFASLGMPGIIWRGEKFGTIQVQFIPQLFSGLIVLVALLNVYLIGQKKRLDRVRDGLIRNVLTRAEADTSPITDRLTKVFATSYMEAALEREIARADRTRSPLTLALFDVVGMNSVNSNHGILAGDYLLLVTGQLLKKTFRGADIICRYGGDQFLVLLPDTSAAQAQHAFDRVRDAIAMWNANSELNYDLELRVGVATYICGLPVQNLIPAAKEKLRQDKEALAHVLSGKASATLAQVTDIRAFSPATSSAPVVNSEPGAHARQAVQ